MKNKKLGILLIVLAILAGLVIFSFMGELYSTSAELNCFPNEELFLH